MVARRIRRGCFITQSSFAAENREKYLHSARRSATTPGLIRGRLLRSFCRLAQPFLVKALPASELRFRPLGDNLRIRRG